MTADEFRVILREALYGAARALDDPEEPCDHPEDYWEKLPGASMTADAIPVLCVSCGEKVAIPLDRWEEHIDGSSQR